MPSNKSEVAGRPRRIAAGGSGSDLSLTPPQSLPDEWYAVWEKLITDMRRDSEALPMNTVMNLLAERIATLYVQVRLHEDVQDMDYEDARSLQRLWLNICTELNTQLHRNSQTPDQRFVATFKASFSAALREAGPDCMLRDFMPIVASHLREYGM